MAEGKASVYTDQEFTSILKKTWRMNLYKNDQFENGKSKIQLTWI